MTIRTDDPISAGMDLFFGPGLDYFNQRENERNWNRFGAQQEQRAQQWGGELEAGYDRAMWGMPASYTTMTEIPGQPGQFAGGDWVPGYEGVAPLSQRLGAASTDYYGGAGQRFQDVMDPAAMNRSWIGRTQAGQQAGADILTGARGRETASAATGAGIVGGYGNLRDWSQGVGQGITGGYGQRLNTGMGMIEGAGMQERRDINRQYEGYGAQQQADMAARGLTGTTLAPSMQMGVQRERRDALGRLDERLLQQRTGLYGQLSGEALGAAERQQGYGAGLWGAQLGAQAGQQGIANQLSADRLGVMGENRAFNADLTGDQLQERQAMQAAQLGYGDQSFQAMQANQLGYGMLPIQQGLQGTQGMVDYWTNQVQYAPPPMYG